MKRLHCEVFGKVQSCGFREFCWKCARKAGVTGWVLNDTGNHSHVTLEIQGDEAAIEKFLGLLMKEKERCCVDSLEQTEIAADPEETAFKNRR